MADFTDVLTRVSKSYTGEPVDPRLRWRMGDKAGLKARPEQLVPPLADDWRVCYFQGGRGSGKTRAGAQALAEWVLDDTDGEGEYGIIAPTYADAWTKCVEGKAGILRALGTSMKEVKDHRSATVKAAWRTYGQVVLHNGVVIYADSAAEGGLRIQGRNLKGAWCLRSTELIATIRGDVPIRDVRPGDLVMTRAGWRKVTGQALTRRNAPLVRITASDGRTVDCTPDHPVWTARGWIVAGRLRIGDTLSVWSTSSRGHRPGTTGTAPAGIARTAATTLMTRGRAASRESGCTSRSGRSTTGSFRPGTLSTTVTTTGTTTSPATWRQSPGPGTTSITSTAPSGMQGPGHGSVRDRWRLSLSGLSALSPARMRTAGESSRRRVPGARSASAPGDARRTHAAVVSVRPAGRDDVYDLSVDGMSEFFANGVLVHNCDEIGLWEKWETAWNESLRYAVRDGISKIIATGTPKAARPARKLVRALIRNDPGEGGVIVRRLRTIDNKDNLSDEFLRSVIGAAQGTRLERQELEGELLDDVANALWTRDLLDAIRVYAGVGDTAHGGPEWVREIKIGVDPSDGGETSDEQAYTVVGLGPVEDGHLWVMENWGGQCAPVPFAQQVITRALRLGEQHGCPVELIIEKNHGGMWLKATFEQTMRQMKVRVPYRVIHASQAKRVRAEPVSALYAMHGGIVRHCHVATYDTRDRTQSHRVPDPHMPELEDQMATFTGAAGERSPDRLDSLVWALSPYLRRSFGPPGKHGARKWAMARELDEMAEPPIDRARRRLAEAHGGAYANDQRWSLESFAPADDTNSPEAQGSRGNVRSWR